MLNNGLPIYVINSLHTNLYRKSLRLRKTKTDRIDARTIATMLMSDVTLKSYTDISYHNEELKSLTRYRFDKVRERVRLKQSISRLVTILKNWFQRFIWHLFIHFSVNFREHIKLPFLVSHISKKILSESSQGRYGREKAMEIRDVARLSIGSSISAKSLELKHTIQLIHELNKGIDEIIDTVNSTITTIPGLGKRMGAMILEEIGDFSKYDSPDKILAYAGTSPSIRQSGQLTNCYSHMEKRGSRYLRYALLNATKYVCIWDPVFAAYLAKKRVEGKHYNVAISHAAKKPVRVIYALQKTGQPYRRTT